jgi:hypothetical protein
MDLSTKEQIELVKAIGKVGVSAQSAQESFANYLGPVISKVSGNQTAADIMFPPEIDRKDWRDLAKKYKKMYGKCKS